MAWSITKIKRRWNRRDPVIRIVKGWQMMASHMLTPSGVKPGALDAAKFSLGEITYRYNGKIRHWPAADSIMALGATATTTAAQYRKCLITVPGDPAYTVPDPNADGPIGGDWNITAGAAVTLTGAGNIRYRISGVEYYCALDTTITLADDGDVDAGKWRAWRIEIDEAGAVTATADGDTQYDEEEIALMNLGRTARTAGTATIGYFTIDSNGGFNIGTDDVNGETAANLHLLRKSYGLNAYLAATPTATAVDTDAATFSVPALRPMVSGVVLAEIAASANQTIDDADTIGTLKYGGWLLVVDAAGTGTYLLAVDGAAGGVSGMTYASQTLLDTGFTNLLARLPEMFIPVCKIEVYNGTAGDFTAGTTKWDADDVTTTVTNLYPWYSEVEVEVGTAAATAAAAELPTSMDADRVPVAIVKVPVSYTSGTTAIDEDWIEEIDFQDYQNIYAED